MLAIRAGEELGRAFLRWCAKPDFAMVRSFDHA